MTGKFSISVFINLTLSAKEGRRKGEGRKEEEKERKKEGREGGREGRQKTGRKRERQTLGVMCLHDCFEFGRKRTSGNIWQELLCHLWISSLVRRNLKTSLTL